MFTTFQHEHTVFNCRRMPQERRLLRLTCLISLRVRQEWIRQLCAEGRHLTLFASVRAVSHPVTMQGLAGRLVVEGPRNVPPPYRSGAVPISRLLR